MRIKSSTTKIIGILVLLSSIVIVQNSCRKPEIQKHNSQNLHTMSATASQHINMEDIFAKLPQTLMYNLGNNAQFDLGRAQWINATDYLLIRIPTSKDSNSYLYATQRYDSPGVVNVYAVHFLPDANSTDSKFSGKKLWINLQDWHYYGIQYKNDAPVSYLKPVKIADQGWEECALTTGQLHLDGTGKFVMTPSAANGGTSNKSHMVTMNDETPNYGCYGEDNFFDDIGKFFSGVGSWFGGLWGSIFGGWGDDGGGDPGGSGWDPGGSDPGGDIGGGIGGSGFDDGSWYNGGGHGPNPGGAPPIWVGGNGIGGGSVVIPYTPPTTTDDEPTPGLTDDDPDLQYWDITWGGSYPHQNLPTWADMYANYPKDANGHDLAAGQVYALVGGTVYGMYQGNPASYGNACALRVSRALNYSGVTIQHIPGETFQGADGKYYFLGAAKLFNWMSKTFGSTGSGIITVTNAQGGPNGLSFNSYLTGHHGIYILKPVSQRIFGASGHATLYDGSNCMISSLGHPGDYFQAAGGVDVIRLWILP